MTPQRALWEDIKSKWPELAVFLLELNGEFGPIKTIENVRWPK